MLPGLMIGYLRERWITEVIINLSVCISGGVLVGVFYDFE
jgi:hypothetical protein